MVNSFYTSNMNGPKSFKHPGKNGLHYMTSGHKKLKNNTPWNYISLISHTQAFERSDWLNTFEDLTDNLQFITCLIIPSIYYTMRYIREFFELFEDSLDIFKFNILLHIIQNKSCNTIYLKEAITKVIIKQLLLKKSKKY